VKVTLYEQILQEKIFSWNIKDHENIEKSDLVYIKITSTRREIPEKISQKFPDLEKKIRQKFNEIQKLPDKSTAYTLVHAKDKETKKSWNDLRYWC